ncbi:molybdopterin-dependent oxidoreductase [Beijerinckia sp. L45]|uniref:molybdopterin-dependent oxidoreductase n=1 Tax=Beijerinckia sp. L45 TaxID=1641855 RepID=UPI00131C0C4D|nr:molybdopterin-dependent oxidoreductase [Beijerinckia sp. L45]
MQASTSETRSKGYCALCKSRCGAILVTKDGRFIGQEPDPDHPTGQALCIKGRAAPEIIYNTERQLHPLKRTRPKGDPDPGWVRISWDEALTTTAAALDRIRNESGAEAVAFGLTTPSGTPISDNLRWIERFTNAFGSPNVASGTEICNWHKDHAHAYTFGRGIASPDFEQSECIVLWGHNPSATWLDHATAASAAKARGARLVVVDPRRVGFAARADQWLRVRPGADGALALGIAGEMIRNGWYDAAFVRDWTNGPLLVRADTDRFLRAGELSVRPPQAEPDDLVAWSVHGPIAYSPTLRLYRDGATPVLEHTAALPASDGGTMACRTAFGLYRDLCDSYPPERVEEVAWVPAAQVRDTARLLFEARPVSYYAWSGVGQHTNATQTDRAIATLMALTGSFDAPGGNVDFAKPAAFGVSGAAFISAKQRAKCVGLKNSALGPGRNGWIGSDALYDAILDADPYRIQALVGFGRNFLVNHANGQRGERALAALDFYVHADIVMTPTAAFADIFLPINTPWERDAVAVGFDGSQRANNLVQYRQAAIASEGESRSDGFIVFELAKRLGLGHLFWDGDIDAALDALLAPLDLSLAALRANPSGISVEGKPHYFRYRTDGFKTQTGKIEIFSEVFRDAGEDPLPRFVEPAETPMGAASREFPLVLTSAKVVHYCHGQHRHVASLRRRSPDPEVTMHPDAAASRGIAEGDWVDICTAHGRARMRTKLDSAFDPRVVSAQYGWWQGNAAIGRPAFDAFEDTGANFNRLIADDRSDPVSGATGLRSAICDIVPIKSGAAWAGWRVFDLGDAVRETVDIVSFTLTSADGLPLPAARGGQHITLRVESPGAAARVRCYTLSRASGAESYRISVKRARDGGLSDLLHAAALPLRVSVMAPKGGFHLGAALPDHDPPVLVASGIGITPLLAMLHELRDSKWTGPVHLLYGVRSGAHYAFRSELGVLQRDLPRLTITSFYSAPTDADRAARNHREGRITAAAILEAAAPASPIYICGPPGMIADVTSGLERAGVAADRIRLEAFGPSSRAAVPSDTGPQEVRLARSGAVLQWVPGLMSILDLIEAAGITASSGCRTGQCESCALGLISGTVAHPEGTAKPGDGRILPCAAIPLSALTLDI